MKYHKIKKFLLTALKIVLFGLLVFLIVFQIKAKGDSGSLWENFVSHFSWRRFPLLIIAIALMPLNWLLESIKWRTFIITFQKDFSLSKAFQSILCGTFFAFITPNRIGEFGGRLNKIEKENWPKALTAGFWGGVAQFLVTFSIGVYMGWKAFLNITGLEKNGFGVLLAVLLLAGFLLFFFFNLKMFIGLFHKIPLLAKRLKGFQFDFEMPKKALVKVMSITLIRYLIYVNQYVLILFFLGIDTQYSVLFAATSAMLFFHTAFPSVPFIDIGIKGNALLILLKNQTNNDVAIALAVILIWIINIIIPAVIGYAIFAKVKAARKLESLESEPQAG